MIVHEGRKAFSFWNFTVAVIIILGCVAVLPFYVAGYFYKYAALAFEEGGDRFTKHARALIDYGRRRAGLR